MVGTLTTEAESDQANDSSNVEHAEVPFHRESFIVVLKVKATVEALDKVHMPLRFYGGRNFSGKFPVGTPEYSKTQASKTQAPKNGKKRQRLNDGINSANIVENGSKRRSARIIDSYAANGH
jgi:hypothetical protein